MSEVGRILSQAGRDVGSAIGGIGRSAIDNVIRAEQLRQQEFRSQLDMFDLMQRQRISALQLTHDVRRLDLLEDQIGLAGRQFQQEQEEFRLGKPRREVEQAILEAQRRQEEAQAAIVEEALPVKEEEKKRKGIGDIVTEALPGIGRALGLGGPKPKVIEGKEAPVEEPILGERGQRIVSGIQQFFSPPPREQITQPPDTAQVAPAAPLFEVPEPSDVTDISLEEQQAARATFQQEVSKLGETARGQLREGVGLEALKDLFRRTAQATANIRRRNL